MTTVLGLAAYYHDASATLIDDGEIIAAAQEERFTRKKHDAAFPSNAIKSCLEEHALRLADVDYIVFYEKPFLKFERLLETYISFAPRGIRSFNTALPIWLREKLFQKDLIAKELRVIDSNFDDTGKLHFSEHHLSHAASAFYPSPFKEAVVLTLDGVGEWATTTAAIGSGNKLDLKREIKFPHSLGLLYSAFTYYCGFRVNSGEYKLMGLAPYGEPRFKDKILNSLIDVRPDGSFWLDQSYFNYCTGLTMTGPKFDDLFGMPRREPETEELTQFHMDLASSIQAVTEEVIIKLAKGLREEYGIPNLCLAGGVALNCVANGKLQKEKIFDRIWVQPAAGDAGGSLGAALALWHKEFDNQRQVKGDRMKGSYLGPIYQKNTIIAELKSAGAIFTELDKEKVIKKTAEALAEGKAVGWFNGRMEFGPRALGNRSIIADPRSPLMQKTLNLKVKFRESFRPFAPSVLCERANQWFELDCESPYMLLVANVHKNHKIEMSEEDQNLFGIDKLNIARSNIPAVTHVDYSARVQTVSKDTNPTYHALISEFQSITGCPVLVNTSFNVRGEPIVCSPTDAFNCFMGTDLDLLVIENILLRKNDQDQSLIHEYHKKIELD